MPPGEVFAMAFESLRANKLRSALTMLGMIIGVGAVILLVSIGNGARNYITSEFQGMGTNFVVIQPGKTDARSTFGPPMGGTKRPLMMADVEALQKQAMNLDAVSPLMYGTATIATEGRSVNAHVFGTNEQMFRIFNFRVWIGDAFNHEEAETGRRVVVLGYKVAMEVLGVATNMVGRTVRINESEHRVVGVLEKSGQKLGFDIDHVILIPTKSAMRLFNDDRLFGIRAKARSLTSINDAVAEIRQILKARHGGAEDFTIVTQVAMLGTLTTIMGMLTWVLAGIAMISMIVGGIGIMNIMLVSVRERTREIGIRRAVGARRRDILRQFLVEAVVLALLGGLTGVAGAVALTHVVSWFTHGFDMRAPAWILPPAFGLSLLTGVVFGVWPARIASRIETIDALRYE